MNRIEKTANLAEAANYFKEGVREDIPDISREQLCAMVDDYLYYQQSDVSRNQAHAVVEKTCVHE